MIVLTILYIAFVILAIAGMWKTFTKAGQPGWACLVPIYNYVVMCEIARKPTWWLIMILIVPIANIIFIFKLMIAIAEKFGKGTGFGVGMVFLSPIFFAILGLGGAQYQGTKPGTPPAAPVA